MLLFEILFDFVSWYSCPCSTGYEHNVSLIKCQVQPKYNNNKDLLEV